MAYCSRCGSKVENSAQFCPQCGAPVNQTAPASSGSDFNSIDAEGKDYTSTYSASDIAENKMLCILCYLGILLLIPLLVKQDSKYVRFHCNQGLLLLIFDIIISIVAVVPLIGWLVSVVGYVASLVFLVMGIVNTCNGRAKTLPIIGNIATLIK